jgi:hypothetical protein
LKLAGEADALGLAQKLSIAQGTAQRIKAAVAISMPLDLNSLLLIAEQTHEGGVEKVGVLRGGQVREVIEQNLQPSGCPCRWASFGRPTNCMARRDRTGPQCHQHLPSRVHTDTDRGTAVEIWRLLQP